MPTSPSRRRRRRRSRSRSRSKSRSSSRSRRRPKSHSTRTTSSASRRSRRSTSRSRSRSRARHRRHRRRSASRSRSRGRGRTTSSKRRRRRRRRTSPSRSRSRGRHRERAAAAVVADLPIHKVREELVALVKTHQVVVVTGDTGSGKSTQISKFLYEAGMTDSRRAIAVTQPRRIGAVSVSRRVAEEMRCSLGSLVGYSIRFDDKTTSQTRIKFMTDGVLLRECLAHPLLEPYSVIVLDEAHERSLHTDILFGVLKRVLAQRPDLKLIVTSATLDTDKFSAFYGGAPCFHIEGRCYPVKVVHSPRTEKYYVQAAVKRVLDIHLEEEPGHILLFLTGQEEIERACRLLGERLDAMYDDGVQMDDIVILPLYAALPAEEQKKIFAPTAGRTRKVVVSTNISETSLTVDGVVYVVDPGYVKQRQFRVAMGMDSLVVVPISKVAATQRMGRAGRTKPGVCYRLYTEEDFEENMADVTVPEIQRTPLIGTVLTLKSFGIANPLAFEFLDMPSQDALVDALRQLFFMDAIDADGQITPLGSVMAQFPIEPALAKLLVTGVQYGCEEEILTVAAMLSVERVWLTPTGEGERAKAAEKRMLFTSVYGDLISLLCLFDTWLQQQRKGNDRQWCRTHFVHARSMLKAKSVREQLGEILSKQRDAIGRLPFDLHKTVRKGSSDGITRARKAIAHCLYPHAARHVAEGAYKVRANEQMGRVYLHPTSCLAQLEPEWVVYTDLTYTAKPYLTNVSTVKFKWIQHLLPRLGAADIVRLCGGEVVLEDVEMAQVEQDEEVAADQEEKVVVQETKKRKKDDEVQAAKARYLARKRAAE